MSTTPDKDATPDKDIEAAVASAVGSKKPRTLVAVVIMLVVAVAAYFGVTKLLDGDSKGASPSSGTTTTSTGKSKSVGARTPEQIKESGYVRIGVFGDKSPFGYVDEHGKNVGYDVEYARRIADDLGVELQLVEVVADSRVEFLTSGKVDIILANFTVTAERAEKVDFVNPYMKVSLGAVSSKDDPITDPAQIDGKRVIVVKGTTADTYISANHPEWKVTKYDQYSDVYNAMIDGRGDVWVTDNTEALAFALQNEDRFVAGITSLGPVDTIAGAVQKGNVELQSWLNEELIDLGEENFFHAAFTTWLEPVYGDAVDPDELVVEGGIVE